MKKLTLILILPLLFVSSEVFCEETCEPACETIFELEDKKGTEKAISITYEQDWEKVYNAVSYVWRRNGRNCINQNILFYLNQDYAREEKAIYIKSGNPPYNRIAIFFEPLEKGQTRVDYVKADSCYFELQCECLINGTIEDVAYLLRYGEQAYREYFQKLFKKELKKREERKPSHLRTENPYSEW